MKTQKKNSNRLLIVVNDFDFFISHRLPIATAAKQDGYDVHVAYGSPYKYDDNLLITQGIKFHWIPIRRGGMNPFIDFRLIFLLWILFKQLKPHLVHLVTIKPMIYGGIVARITGVPAVVFSITGLGFIFINQSSVKSKFLYFLVKILFKLALSNKSKILIFQNIDDRNQILALSHFSPQQAKLIRGSGINLDACPILPEPDGVPIIVMASRLLRDKGVFEFTKAASILLKQGISARFWLIGEPDLANPTSLSIEDIKKLKLEGCVEFMGYCENVPYYYSKSHIVVLPSYREGLPKSLIEAAACARPVVTTDVPGCRDAIEPGITGLLVPPRDAISLAVVLERLIKDSSLRQIMGSAGRNLAEREFCIKKVVNQHLQIYQNLIKKCESQ